MGDKSGKFLAQDFRIENHIFVESNNLIMKRYLLVLFFGSIIIGYGQTPGGGVTDIEGNTYETVIIGPQEWMTKNLNVSHFNDGTSIKEVTNISDWKDAIKKGEPAFCYLNFNRNNESKFGKIYNFHATTSHKLAPNGFHISTNQDWVDLIDYIGGIDNAKRLKAKTGWKSIRIGNNIIACSNCKNWAKSYRKKNSCHVCKDTRDSGKRTPIKYLSGNGSDFYGFYAKESGLMERNKFKSRGTAFWTKGDLSLNNSKLGLGSTVFYNDNVINENGNRNIERCLLCSGIELYKDQKQLEAGYYIRCLKGESRVLQEEVFLNKLNDAINTNVLNKDFQLGYEELKKEKYDQVDEEYLDKIEYRIDIELKKYMKDLFDNYRFEEFFEKLNTLNTSKGYWFIWANFDIDFETYCKNNLYDFKMIDKIDLLLFHLKNSKVINNDPKVYDKYVAIRNEMEMNKVIQTKMTDFEKKIVGVYKMKSRQFDIQNRSGKFLIKSNITIKNNREMIVEDELKQTGIVAGTRNLAEKYRGEFSPSRYTNKVIFRAHQKENNIIHIDYYYSKKSKTIKDTYEFKIDNNNKVSYDYPIDNTTIKLEGKKVK